MAADVLALHVPRRLEVLVPVREAHETVSLALGRALVADDARLLDAAVAREGLEQRLVRDLTRQVAHEQAEVRWVPLEQRRILPGLTAASADDRLLLAIRARHDGRNARVGVRGRVDVCIGTAVAGAQRPGVGACGGTGACRAAAPGVVLGHVRALPLRNLCFHLRVHGIWVVEATVARLARQRKGVADLGRRGLHVRFIVAAAGLRRVIAGSCRLLVRLLVLCLRVDRRPGQV